MVGDAPAAPRSFGQLVSGTKMVPNQISPCFVNSTNDNFVWADQKELFCLAVADFTRDEFAEAAPERFYGTRIQIKLFASLTPGCLLRGLSDKAAI